MNMKPKNRILLPLATLAGLALAARPFAIITAFVMACSVSQSQATVIASYAFTGGSPTSSDTELNSTAGNFTVTQPSGTAGDLGFSTTSNNAFARSLAITGTTVAAAVTYGNFFSFAATPGSGYELNLTTLTFDSIHNNTSGTAGTPNGTVTMNFFIRSSVDAYAANVGSVFSQAYNTTTTGRSVDLTGASFQNLSSAVTFRLYVYESTDVSTNQGARWDNVVLNGSVAAVPEPSAALLGGLGGLLLLRRRR